MKIQLLGTGAAEGIPALFANSRVSEYARKHGGKDVRTRSSALIDDEIKIDLPPDIHHQVTQLCIDPTIWSGIVFTHSHDDHLAPNELQYSLYPFTDAMMSPYTIYGNETVLTHIADRYDAWPFELVRTCSFHPFMHGDYEITPVKANHKLDEDSQNLIVRHAGKSVFYATDTGLFLEETWEFLRSGFRFDCLVIECTDGFKRTNYYGHMDIKECVRTVERLREMGALSGDATVVTTHHGHWGDATHAELEDALAPHGIVPGYDGITIEF